MKKLKEKFKSRGFVHEQIARERGHAIYRRYSASGQKKNTTHYEVIKIGRHNGYKLGESYIEPAETYPSASMWGIAGWTSTTVESAYDRLHELVKYSTV